MYPSVIIIVDVAVIDVVYSSILSTTTSEMAKMDKQGQKTEDRDNKKVLLQWMCSCLDNFFVVIVVVIRSLARSLS